MANRFSYARHQAYPPVGGDACGDKRPGLGRLHPPGSWGWAPVGHRHNINPRSRGGAGAEQGQLLEQRDRGAGNAFEPFNDTRHDQLPSFIKTGSGQN